MNVSYNEVDLGAVTHLGKKGSKNKNYISTRKVSSYPYIRVSTLYLFLYGHDLIDV